MKKIIAIIFLFAALISLSYYAYRNNLFDKKPAGLEVTTNIPARVFLNGEDQGETPYQNLGLKEGEYTLKVVPLSQEQELVPYEAKINLTKAVNSSVFYNYSSNPTDSYGYTLELKEEPQNKAYLSVITNPDTANISLDNTPQGYTPISKKEITPGKHELSLSSPGYQPLTLEVSTVLGYNLIAKIKLGASLVTFDSPSPSPSPPPSSSPLALSSPSPSPMAKPFLIIKDTETGWLRVRESPSSTAQEIGKATVGLKLKYLGETTEDGWHQVEFEGQTGWISGKYATLEK